MYLSLIVWLGLVGDGNFMHQIIHPDGYLMGDGNITYDTGYMWKSLILVKCYWITEVQSGQKYSYDKNMQYFMKLEQF